MIIMGKLRRALGLMSGTSMDGIDVALIERTVHVLDAASRMLLVEATADQLASLVRALPHWKAVEERSFSLVI